VVEEGSDAGKDQDDHKLKSNTSHVDLHSDVDGVLVTVCVGKHTSTSSLDKEEKYIEADKEECHANGLDTKELSTGHAEVYHACYCHVYKCIDPWLC
jgi:hypothetical protein